MSVASPYREPGAPSPHRSIDDLLELSDAKIIETWNALNDAFVAAANEYAIHQHASDRARLYDLQHSMTQLMQVRSHQKQMAMLKAIAERVGA